MTRLRTSCSCLNASQWAVNVMRILTVCPGPIDCSLPWISLLSPGQNQYGVASVSVFMIRAHMKFSPLTLNLSDFSTSTTSLDTNITLNSYTSQGVPCPVA